MTPSEIIHNANAVKLAYRRYSPNNLKAANRVAKMGADLADDISKFIVENSNRLSNPGAISNEILERIDRMLSQYEVALENILYKNLNPTEDLKEIRDLRHAIEYARYGETDGELMRSFEEHGG